MVVQGGSLDVAVVYNPPQRPGLVVELLCEEKLIMVTTTAEGKLLRDRYVYVDWGPAFAANHEAAFAELCNPPVSVSLGPLALTYLLSVGGAGYFRIGTTQPFLDDVRLHRVEGAPEFSHSACAVYAEQRDNETLGRVRGGLRLIASREGKSSLDQGVTAHLTPVS